MSLGLKERELIIDLWKQPRRVAVGSLTYSQVDWSVNLLRLCQLVSGREVTSITTSRIRM
jgi:hypothetical protein